MSFGSRSNWCNFTPAGICEECIDVPMFLFHNGIEPVQILKACYVASDRRDVFTDKGCGLFQFFLASASDYDVRTFFDEALGRGQSNPAAAARDDCDLTFNLFHGHLSFLVSGRLGWGCWVQKNQLRLYLLGIRIR